MLESITLKSIPKLIKLGVVFSCLGMVVLLGAYGERAGLYYYALSYGIHMALVGLGCCCLVVVLHEGLHGLFFWIFSGRVSFGAKLRTSFGPVFWASSPVLISRIKSQIIALAPQIMSIGLLLAMIPASPVARYFLILGAYANIAGGFFDIYVATRLAKFSRECLVRDTQDGVEIYGQSG